MKTLSVVTILIVCFVFPALAQSKNDSLKLKRDLESISKGEKVEPLKKSILHVEDTLPVKIDSTALKPGLPQPTPVDPNNPNPHDAVPNPINPSSPAQPTGYPQAPPVDINESKSIRKE